MFGLREKLIIVLLGLVALAAAVGPMAYFVLSNKAAKSEETANVAKADAVASGVYLDEYKKVTHEAAVRKARTEEVLARNRSWADEPVPDDVADLLRDPQRPASEVPR